MDGGLEHDSGFADAGAATEDRGWAYGLRCCGSHVKSFIMLNYQDSYCGGFFGVVEFMSKSGDYRVISFLCNKILGYYRVGQLQRVFLGQGVNAIKKPSVLRC